jgi:hypothetical protein
MSQQDIRGQWETATSQLAFQVNAGWWLQRWLPLVLGIGIAGTFALLLLRMLHINHAPWSFAALGIGLLVSMLVAWLMARRGFESKDQARVRLEDALGLKTRLSAAAQGVGAWPMLPVAQISMPLTWRWQRPLGMIALAAALLAFALWVPVPERAEKKTQLIEKPSAVQQVEAWVDQLRGKDVIQPESLAEVEKKMEDLLKRPGDQWYEHASLEAADNLRDQTGKSLQELGTQLEQTRGNLTALAELGSSLSEATKNGMAKQLSQNLQGLRSGAMKADADLLQQLQSMDPKSLSGMSKEQMQKLQERLKQNAEALRQALANAPEFDFKECAQCTGNRDSDQLGEGDPKRGKGDAQLTVKKDETNLNTQRTEGMNPNLDPERVAPGDLLGMQDGKHRVDETARMNADGGTINSTGEGGAAVWKESLLPSEREVLKRYFK